MSGETVREWLAGYLTPLVPASWRIVPNMTAPKTIDAPTVTLTHTRISKQPQAPLSDNLVNDVVIRVTDPHQDPDRAEDALDGEVLALVYALRASENLVWSEAEKVKPADQSPYLAWDVTVQVITTHTPEE